MKPSTVGLTTVGCKLNQYETEGIAESLEAAGFRVVPFEEVADAYVVNTCTVTARSDYRSRQMLRRAARTNPRALVVATGCYAQVDARALASMPEVQLVAGNSAKTRIAELLLGLAEKTGAAGAGGASRRGGAVQVVGPIEPDRFDALDIERFRGYTRAFVKIQDGCDGGCAYCAVPGARGPSRSRPFADVIRQARRLAEAGHREVVLTGVHIGAYRSEGRELPDLLHALVDLPGLERVRLGSVEPGELTDELASAIVTLPGVCRHLHVPLESGSADVLGAMRRAYTPSEYARAVRRVTDRLPSCGLGADVMVGFPGETDRDFEETAALIRDLPFTYLHVFAFSPRAGTAAAALGGGVAPEVKRARSRRLRALGRDKSLAFRRGLVGTTVEVLTEAPEGDAPGTLAGLTSTYVRVRFRGDERLRNTLVSVRVEGADHTGTWGSAEPGTAR